MKVKLLITAVLVAFVVWLVAPILAYRDAGSVSKWISLIPVDQREQFVYERLNDIGQPNYVKVALLEAIATDLSSGEGRFPIKDFQPMLNLTKWKNEPLGEPVGILAGRVLLATKDCTVIKRFRLFYEGDPITSKWIETNATRANLERCL